MADSRHIYWWSIPRIEEGPDKNTDLRFDTASGLIELNDIGETGSTSWSSIHQLCSDIQAALRLQSGFEAATVFVDLDLGQVVFNTGTAQLLAPAPYTDAQWACHVLLGGSSTVPSPAPVFAMPETHANGVYIFDAVAQDSGDSPQLTAETATSLAGAARMYRWATGYQRKLGYQWLTENRMQGLRQLFADAPHAVILLDDPNIDWGDIPGSLMPNYIIEKPAAFPARQPVVGLPRYHVSWTLGRR